VSGTNGPNPPTVTQLPGVTSSFWANIGGVGADGEATALITLNGGKLKLTDITTNPPTVIAELAENVGGGIIGPDGCLYMPNANALYRLTGSAGGCGFLLPDGAPSLTLTPTAVSPDPAQGTALTFTATFRNLGVPAGTPVILKVIGPNLQALLARTDATGWTSFTYAGTFTGTDALVATASVNSQTLVSNVTGVTWTAGRHTTFLSLNKSVSTGTPTRR
jgi:hypothetical protein